MIHKNLIQIINKYIDKNLDSTIKNKIINKLKSPEFSQSLINKKASLNSKEIKRMYRSDGRWGRHKPLILLGGIIAAIATIYLLNPDRGVGVFYITICASILYFVLKLS